MPSSKRIVPRHAPRIFLKEYRERAGLTQGELGKKLRVTDMTVSRWEGRKAKLSTDVLAAIAEALVLHPEDLFRHPDQVSLDALVRGQADDIKEQATKIIRALLR